MPTELAGTSDYFLNSFLSRPASSIPKGAQWAVFFHQLESSIIPAVQLAYAREPQYKNWKTIDAASILLNDSYQTTHGCIFCTAISVQGEGANVNAGGNIQHSSYLRSYLGGGRQDLSKMRMSFLDTNLSFVDSVLRGWALATTCYGMVARSGEKNYRTNITCYKFGATSDGPFVLQTVTFEGACCIEVSQEEYNYDPKTTFGRREAQFVYHSYSIDSETNNDILRLSKATDIKATDKIDVIGKESWEGRFNNIAGPDSTELNIGPQVPMGGNQTGIA